MRIIFLAACLILTSKIYSQSSFYEVNIEPGINIYTSVYNTMSYPGISETRGNFSIRKNTGANFNFSALFSATTALKLGFGFEADRIDAYYVFGPTVNAKLEFPLSSKISPFIEGAIGFINRKNNNNYDNGLLAFAKAGISYRILNRFFRYVDHLSIIASGGYKFFEYGYSHNFESLSDPSGDGLVYRENFKVINFNLGASIGF
ncbi:hypothetical protein BH10BAC5_BH10BAC5_07050 [soil metagenome]